MKIVTAAQMRAIERACIDGMGIPSLLLMEDAAWAVCKACAGILSGVDSPRAVFFCGTGNNGGDGFAVARHLVANGVETCAVVLGDAGRMSRDCRVNYDIATRSGITVRICASAGDVDELRHVVTHSDLVVDAIFGTGLTREVSGVHSQAIALINKSARYVIAVDIPSGICADTGRVLGCAVRANETVTFGLPKLGAYLYPGAEFCGEIVVDNIALAPSVIDGCDSIAEVYTQREVTALLPHRPARSHKFAFGKVCSLTGCDEMPGAAVMSATAAYKVGCGLVDCCSTRHVVHSVQHYLKEAITTILPDASGKLCRDSALAAKDKIAAATVVLIGSGLSWDENTVAFVQECLKHIKGKVVLDADALNALSSDRTLLDQITFPCVITPHIGEMRRLTGMTSDEIRENPVQTAKNFAAAHNLTVVLKDARTIIAEPGGRVCINITGTNALAKAGSGDVLAGMISGFMAQGSTPYDASVLSCYIHGKAGASAAQTQSSYGVLATDLLTHIPTIINAL